MAKTFCAVRAMAAAAACLAIFTASDVRSAPWSNKSYGHVTVSFQFGEVPIFTNPWYGTVYDWSYTSFRAESPIQILSWGTDDNPISGCGFSISSTIRCRGGYWIDEKYYWRTWDIGAILFTNLGFSFSQDDEGASQPLVQIGIKAPGIIQFLRVTDVEGKSRLGLANGRYLFETAAFTILGNRYDQSTKATGIVGPVYVTVTGGVPEPAVWACLIFGFGLMGVKMRARRVVIVRPSAP